MSEQGRVSEHSVRPVRAGPIGPGPGPGSEPRPGVRDTEGCRWLVRGGEKQARREGDTRGGGQTEGVGAHRTSRT